MKVFLVNSRRPISLISYVIDSEIGKIPPNVTAWRLAGTMAGQERDL